MTAKQKKIIDTALKLFATKGFHATSTGKIAAQAGVSEGLIFRHFGNKEGLLRAVFDIGEEKIRKLYADIIIETDAKVLLRKTLETALIMLNDETQAKFWKLQYKIKWEIEQYNTQKTASPENALTRALDQLGYDHPENEAKLFMLIFDGLATRSFLEDDFNPRQTIDFLKKKYAL